MNYIPIGIIDSGSGGLSIWKEITLLLPGESTVYIGDHAHLPYSEKTTEFIRNRVFKLIQYLVTIRAKLVVIACNTATVAGIDWYREQFPDIPIIGVVPVIKTAVEVTKTKHIAVLSTVYTANSSYQQKLISIYASKCRVEIFSNWEEAIKKHNNEEVFVIGGASLYAQTINSADTLYITHVDKEVSGDTFFPTIDESVWKKMDEEKHDGFSFVTYQKI